MPLLIATNDHIAATKFYRRACQQSNGVNDALLLSTAHGMPMLIASNYHSSDKIPWPYVPHFSIATAITECQGRTLDVPLLTKSWTLHHSIDLVLLSYIRVGFLPSHNTRKHNKVGNMSIDSVENDVSSMSESASNLKQSILALT